MFPFDRLVRAVDEWVGRNRYTEVLVQIGNGAFVPSHAKWVRMMPPLDFAAAIRSCNLVVAHLGMGSIISAMQAQKPIILLPRQLSLGEHTSDHQLHGTEWLKDRPGIWIAEDEAQLQKLLGEFVEGKISQPTDRPSPYASPELIGQVRRFIESA